MISEEINEGLFAKPSALYVRTTAEKFDIKSAATEAAAKREYVVPESSHWAVARQTARASSRRCSIL
jgi:hypothetical protein